MDHAWLCGSVSGSNWFRRPGFTDLLPDVDEPANFYQHGNNQYLHMIKNGIPTRSQCLAGCRSAVFGP